MAVSSSADSSQQSEHTELTKHTVHMVRLYNLHSGKVWKEEHEERLYDYCTASEVELLKEFIAQFTQSHILPLAKKLKKEMRTKVFQQRSSGLISKWRSCYETKIARRKNENVKRSNRGSVNFSSEAQIRYISHRLDEVYNSEPSSADSDCIIQ